MKENAPPVSSLPFTASMQNYDFQLWFPLVDVPIL